jgi:hypothetical protein
MAIHVLSTSTRGFHLNPLINIPTAIPPPTTYGKKRTTLRQGNGGRAAICMQG